ncbi:MAG: hypothetical protein ACK5T6_14075, partial [Pirellula sp.]
PVDQHVMTILTPESVSKYRWKDGSETPEKVESNGDGNSSTNSALKPLAPTPGPTTQGGPAATPNPGNTNQPALVWDPVSGTWQSGGSGGNKSAPKTAQ